MREDLEFSELTDAVRRGGMRIGIGALAGVVVALAVIAFAPVRFTGRAMVLVRTEQASAGGLVRQQLGSLPHLAGDALGLGEGGDALKTELALMQSRALMGDVVDSLRLQVRAGRTTPRTVSVPEGIPQAERFAPVKVRVEGVAGAVRIVDREDAIDDLTKRLDVGVFGGEAIEIVYSSRDSLSAAEVPNFLALRYLERRRTVDRGLNQRRVEFLTAQSDSVRQALAAAAGSLRRAQQGGNVVSLELSERAEVEQRIEMQVQLTAVKGELAALEALLAELASGDTRRLAGFPALLRSPAVNELVAEMGRLETERTLLLADATERSPRVVALAEAIDGLRGQLVPMALTYARALSEQHKEYTRQIAASSARSGTLPAAGEALLLREAEVKQLGQLALSLGVQLLDARLAALGEGGDVRLVDRAVAPRRVSFPRRLITLAVGLFAGLALGLVWALAPLGTRPDAAEA
jgi:uncharacterized protein involved in exopolysaccharide biosynthesis